MSAEAPTATAPPAPEPAAVVPSAAATDAAVAPEVVVVPETPLAKLTALLPDIIKTADYGEVWGVELSPNGHVPTQVVLQKFLTANSNDVAAAEKQLTSALEWRKEVQPAELVKQAFNKKKFGDVGYITTHKDEAGKETIITWNIYGAVKDNKETFGDVSEFIKWRAALMELSVQQLHLNDITEPIPEHGPDPYQMLQVHDYRSVSFFRMDPHVKAASKETIQVFSTAYPELLAHKYFVNVPAIMGWMFGAMKLFLATATLRKFHPMTSGTTLATELKDISASLPEEYGGKGPSVKEGLTVNLVEPETPVDSAEAPVPAAVEAKTADEAVAPVVEEAKPTEVAQPDVASTEPAAEQKVVA